MRKFIILLQFVLSTVFVHAQEMDDTTVLAFASDTQAPMWVETLWLRTHGNRSATKMLFGDIAARRPHTLFLLGDVVNLGYSNRQWKPMDRYLDTLHANGIEVRAILGNHEVMGQPRKGQAKFQKRFPQHKQTGYIEVIDSIAVVLLNSNFTAMNGIENAEQILWYRNMLDSLDKDASIQQIITCCHHSPFTNSKIVSSNLQVQQRFVAYFLKSPKSNLFLSGHSHNFEHYQIGGKDFLVIGGGGGLHQPLKKGSDLLPDLAADYKPFFHYLTLKRLKDGLQLTSYKLDTETKSFTRGKDIVISGRKELATAQ